ncbi:MAG: hypothetical protein ACI4TK_04895 [Agathobacter sp.]
MKNKVAIKPKAEFAKWITISNLFTKSRISPQEALSQFNSLNATQRIGIKKSFQRYDEFCRSTLSREKLPQDELKNIWETFEMVNAHIIATEYGIDPLTVVMCANPICKNNERIILR